MKNLVLTIIKSELIEEEISKANLIEHAREEVLEEIIKSNGYVFDESKNKYTKVVNEVVRPERKRIISQKGIFINKFGWLFSRRIKKDINSHAIHLIINNNNDISPITIELENDR